MPAAYRIEDHQIATGCTPVSHRAHANRTLSDYLTGVYGPGWKVTGGDRHTIIARGPLSQCYPEYGMQTGWFARADSSARFEGDRNRPARPRAAGQVPS